MGVCYKVMLKQNYGFESQIKQNLLWTRCEEKSEKSEF